LLGRGLSAPARQNDVAILLAIELTARQALGFERGTLENDLPSRPAAVYFDCRNREKSWL